MYAVMYHQISLSIQRFTMWGQIKWELCKCEKIEILLCATVCISNHQHWLEACTVHGRHCKVAFMSAEHPKKPALTEACM
jgi:hypothetical protein